MKELRRKDRKIDDTHALKLLIKGEYGVLSTTDRYYQSYGVPLSYVYFENALYFHSALEGHKIDNIANNNKISFCVVGRTETLPAMFSVKYETVIVFGKATEVIGEEKTKALLSLVKKYSSSYLEEGEKYIENNQDKTKVFKIIIKKISGKART